MPVMKYRHADVAADVSPPRSALRFVILLGVTSLFADMTYEGARSITGPYLALLGASATVVGIVAGFGELIDYRSSHGVWVYHRPDRSILSGETVRLRHHWV